MAVERRAHVTHKFEAAGPDEPGAIKKFVLRKTTEHQRRVNGGRWLTDSAVIPPYTFEDIAEFTRETLADLIADGAQWLSYVERG